MVLTKAQHDMLINSNADSPNRGIAPNWAQKWNIEVPHEAKKVGVPYLIHQVFFENNQTIRNAMDEIEANTCIR